MGRECYRGNDASRSLLTSSVFDLAGELLDGARGVEVNRWAWRSGGALVLACHDVTHGQTHIRIDDEGRKRFGDELKNVVQIIGIESDDGSLDFYLDRF